MANLLKLSTLAKWTQTDDAEIASDPFASDLISKVSDLICFIGGHDGTKFEVGSVPPVPILEWSLTAVANQTIVAPMDIQMIALQVIKRSYENPGQVIQAGSIGPLGGDRVADTQALFMDFTEAERRAISKYNIDGDPTAVDGAGEVFVLQTTRGNETTLPQTSPLYATDNLQVGLLGSPDPRPWMIPLFNPGDPGDDALYS